MVTNKSKRLHIGKDYREVIGMPRLIDIQLLSFENFLQRETLLKGEPLAKRGIEEVFQSTFPIESPGGDLVLEYCGYTLSEDNIKHLDHECKKKGARQ